jgi:hypothetical protein
MTDLSVLETITALITNDTFSFSLKKSVVKPIPKKGANV